MKTKAYPLRKKYIIDSDKVIINHAKDKNIFFINVGSIVGFIFFLLNIRENSL